MYLKLMKETVRTGCEGLLYRMHRFILGIIAQEDKRIYEGNESYIFISYSHKDSNAVLSVEDMLAENGFRVWYDSDIEYGDE